MPQFGRPSTDTTRVGWEEDDGTIVDIFDQIDETSPDDGDFIRTGLGPVNSVYVTKLSNMTDPVSSTGHVIRYRYSKDAAAGSVINLTVQLRQGYVSEGSLGTLIQEWIHSDISESLTSAAQTLGTVETDSITNYADLFLRFVANQA